MRHLIVLLLLTVASLCKAQKTYVVAVGICDYADKQVKDLRCCENDVESFCTLMRKHGAAIEALKGNNATKTNILSALRSACTEANADDIVVFFFSGHGYPGGFCPYEMTSKSSGISYSDVQTLFKSCKASRKLVFADACYSGGLRKDDTKTVNAARNGEVMFFLSSRTKETSQEVVGGENGQFTRFLVRGLGGGADKDRNRIITARELYDFVHEGVAVATYNKQNPVMWGRFDNTMPVIDWRRK